MTEKAENKVETLPDLDDLLQCPVCYEIPSGQIFQCNEGHHVCGRCKMRLDVCPVCRAFFFGTRNYAMEELIANVKKLQAFRLGGKVTTGTPPAEATPDVAESSSEDNESTHENVNEEDDASSRTSTRAPTSCKGLFRCLCCKNNPERLPLGRLLNHLRYYHSPDLIEGRSENGGYLQAWQFPSTPGRMVTAVRVHDMGIFFLVIEITHESVYAWMSMAASPWVANDFIYVITLTGNDREAIYTDNVWSVRSCEGSLKRRDRCLHVSDANARALLTPAGMSGKLSLRRAPHDQQPQTTTPRTVLRVANRSTGAQPLDVAHDVAHDLEPFLQDLQNDVARLSRAFATLGREANALVRSEAEMRARLENAPERRVTPADGADSPRSASPRPADPQPAAENGERQLSRSARRRMRQRLREAFRENHASEPVTSTAPRTQPGPVAAVRPAPRPAAAPLLYAAPRPGSNRNEVARPNLAQTGSFVIGPASNPNVTRVQTNDARMNTRQPIRVGLADNAARVNGPNSNPTPTRANSTQHSRAANEPVVHSIGYLRVVSPPPMRAAPPVAPPPVLPPAFGGPSQNQPANGNTRNKKKRRQRR